MTSPSAQKAASKIDDFVEHHNGFSGRMAPIAEIVQQAITEAVDAAVAPKEKRVKELEAALGAFYSAVYPITHAITNEQLHRAQEDLIVFMANKPRAALEAPHEP